MTLLSLLLALLGTALAAGQHTGVPLASLEQQGFRAPAFETATTGWTAQFPKGLARVYVAPSQAAITAWVDRTRSGLERRGPAPISGLGDEAWGGEDYVLVRDGNVGLLVETAEAPQDQARRLLGLVVDTGEPWPLPARLTRRADGTFVIEAWGAKGLSYVGGSLAPEETGLVFATPPRKVVRWDAFGRAAVQHFDAEGKPVAAPTAAAPAAP